MTYVIYDPSSRDAVVIDSCLDFDPSTMTLSREPLLPLIDFVTSKDLKVHWILETHVHADHVTGANVLKNEWPRSRVGIAESVRKVQAVAKNIFGIQGIQNEEFTSSWPFDGLFKDGEVITAGSLQLKAIATPGHTPACLSYLCADGLFTGDTIFIPAAGTGRCDFPGGDAELLYRSIQKIFKLPMATSIYVGHNYPPADQMPIFKTSVAAEMSENIHVKLGTSVEDFVSFRSKRDLTLTLPRLFYISLYLNIRGGNLPSPDPQGRHFVHFPLFASF
jgi:glyoxylase-like metal-dependent hydrolase (beta-lactamase superfamily II)